MIDSAVRAERFERDASLGPAGGFAGQPGPCYTWEVPEKPVLVRFPLLLIDRLERQAVEAFRSVSSRGSEIGGVLWGVVDSGHPSAVSIVEYEAVPCDYELGPLYRLSGGDVDRMMRALTQAGTGLLPVGFFRSNTRKGLSLDGEDLSLMEACFREPYQIALVVRPFATKASTAGIFIRENGSIRAEASYLEFPFRSSQLAPSKHLAEAVEPAASSAAPVAPKPVVRAQIVPIASRREMGAPPQLAPDLAPLSPEQDAPKSIHDAPKSIPQAPQPAPQPIAQPVPKPAAQPVPEPVVAVKPLPQPVNRTEAPAELMAPAAPQTPETKTAAPPKPPAAKEPGAKTPAAKTPAADLPLKDAATADAPARGHSAGKPIWAAVALVAAVLAVVLFVYPGVFRHTNAAKPAGGQDTSPLALRVEQSAGELLLTWNNDSSAIRNANHAVLSISDGSQRENVDLDLAQLRNGKIEYLPVTGDVVFKMEVVGQDNAKTTSESVRVLRTRPSPMGEENTETAQNASSAPNASPNAAPINTPSNPSGPNSQPAVAADPTPVTAASPVSPAIPVRPFNAASLSTRLRPVHSDDLALPDAPVVAGAGATPSDAALKLTGMAAPPPPPNAAPKKADTPAPKIAPSGGDVQQAQLIYRKQPDYPALARSAGAKGTVELIATIGANGRVKSVKVTKGHPLLQKAAVDAVMQWQYKPTMLNGHPVETETSITLNFVSDR